MIGGLSNRAGKKEKGRDETSKRVGSKEIDTGCVSALYLCVPYSHAHTNTHIPTHVSVYTLVVV